MARMREENFTIPQIANFFDTTQRTIYRTLRRLRPEENNVRQRGRQRKTTPREDRYVVQRVRRQRTATASSINNDLRNTTGVQVSNETIRRRLNEVGLRARRRAACPLLQPRHRATRLRWAQDHENWGIAEWSRCLFTDESKFNFFRSDGRVLVWRRTNERFKEEHMEARVAFGGGGVTVWGGMSMNGKSELVILRGESMNGARYRDLCVRDIVVPYAQNFGDDFILVDDNARPHRARIVNEILADHGIERMEWPPLSPDMNPIEHVWSRMKRKMKEWEGRLDNLDELVNAIQHEWDAIPQEFLQALVESMPRRVAALIRSRGGPTKY